jgi:D-alanine transaminase
MARTAYVNGQYQPYGEAGVHIDDRGYQFADGVYEVIAVIGGLMLDEIPHLDRLDRSLAELSIEAPMSRPALRHVLRETLRRNRLSAGILYLQITRGVAKRDHPFPKHAIPSIRRQRQCRGQRDHHPRLALAALRHQIDCAAAQYPCQTGGALSGRL